MQAGSAGMRSCKLRGRNSNVHFPSTSKRPQCKGRMAYNVKGRFFLFSFHLYEG